MVRKLLDDFGIDTAPWESKDYNYNDEYKVLSTLEILKEIDKASDIREEDPDKRKHDGKRFQRLIRVLACRLEFTLAEDVTAELRKSIFKLGDAIEELNRRFSNHRHEKNKEYSEKPVY